MISGIALLICCVRTHAALNITTKHTVSDVSETTGWVPLDAPPLQSNRKLMTVTENVAAMIAYIGVLIVGSVGIVFVIWSLCINEHEIPAHAATTIGEAEYHTLRSI